MSDSAKALGSSHGAGLTGTGCGVKTEIAGTGLSVCPTGLWPTEPAMTPCMAVDGATISVPLAIRLSLSMNIVPPVISMMAETTATVTATRLSGRFTAGSLTATTSPI